MEFNLISNDIAIDFGTSNTRIYIKGRGLVLDEPSVIAYDTISGDIIAAGAEAYAMTGRTPNTVAAVFPLAGGVICECTLAEELLKALLRRVCPKTIIKPRIIIAIPCGVTDVERRALRDAAIVAGARRVYIMESPIAAAIGASCDVAPARGMMVADLGGGSCDIAVISLGQVVSSVQHKLAGAAFTDAVIAYFRERHSLAVGFQSAEKCKIDLGCVFSRDTLARGEVTGLDITTGLPSKITVTSEDIKDALTPVCEALAEAIKKALDEAPSELLGDILEDGILLTGGLSQMPGLVKRLRIDTEMKVFAAPEGAMCVVRGLAAAIENLDRISKDSYTLYQG